jgi:hypothetical protein
MSLLAIVYFSISGTTEKLAQAIARGATTSCPADSRTKDYWRRLTALAPLHSAARPTWAARRLNLKPLLTLQATDGAGRNGPTRSRPDLPRAFAQAEINSIH